ncbi:prolyl oligopeptidase family serine peptidase [Fontisphaera persica]|uniref:prolyl oligopeptidase family serine peptidase n=1 Tax=Fontisphaera persica TaxID=2974023 RepID=UPI0024C043D6|nr:prolyl oligopeptidase family serine peptidase [Fontisphaera persica]WCJ60604.1 prolyl oligopeptidase family serine peptidase [Fontisphaera persica]
MKQLWLCAAVWAGVCLTAEAVNLPATPQKPVVDHYHGQAISDPYQWLEDGQNPEVRQWTEAQNAAARAYLDALPERPWIERRLRQLLQVEKPSYYGLQWAGGRLFALRFQPPRQQPELVFMAGPDDTNGIRVILDLNRFDARGRTSMDFYAPSPDGKIVAVCLSENGSEVGTLHFFTVDNGRKMSDVLPRVQYPTGGGSVAWDNASQGVFYTRYPAPGERPESDLAFYQQVYYHRLGEPLDKDRYEIGRDFPRIAEIDLSSGPGGWILATVANGDGGEYAHYLRNPAGPWLQVTRFEDKIKQAQFGRDPLYVEWPRDDGLYLLSFEGAPRGKILRVSLRNPTLAQAQTVVEEHERYVIQGFAPSASGLYVHYLVGGPSRLVWWDAFTGNRLNVPLRAADLGGVPAAVQQMLVARGDELLYRSASYIHPPAWQVYNPALSRTTARMTALQEETPEDYDDTQVSRVEVTSKDGTKIPLNILHLKGLRLNGELPALLTGYGGYGISLQPSFDPARRLWLEQGGVWAVANLRGGGEFGEPWHQSGQLTNKQNVFDDFIACAEWLIRSNYTRADRLVIRGGSNGGLLMGAALTQRPDLFAGVIAQVGIFDMLRVERDPNGVFNTTEFGTVQNRLHFEALYAYSPYHRVRDGVQYPAVLLTTGWHDGRVNPAHSRKMAARLQATGSQAPVLLRTSFTTGHGLGSAFNDRVAELADVYAFAVRHSGMKYSAILRGPWSGAVTTTSVWVKARLLDEGLNARLVVSRHPDFSEPVYSAPDRSRSANHNLVGFRLGNLSPNTRYYYALEIDGRLDTVRTGQFRTFPAGPSSFTIAWGTCARTGSTSDVFDRIREHQPLIFINAGDFHYLDISVNSVRRFRAAYDRVLASPQQAELYRAIPFAYVWDDHDFGGNNCNKNTPSRPAARQVYQEYVPHYPLMAGRGDVPIYQSFDIGRVKFLLTDCRSERDPVNLPDNEKKSMLGLRQKTWLKQQLLQAKDKYPLIVWVGSVGWLGERGTNYYPLLSTNQYGLFKHEELLEAARAAIARGRRLPPPSDQEHWCAYTTERREIANFIKDNQIRGVIYLHGDAHSLSADDGRNGDYATGGGAPIPSMGAAPLDKEPSIKGGPFSHHVYRPRPPEGCFGLLHVEDLGEQIRVTFSGRNNKDEEKIRLSFAVPAQPAPAVP